MLPSLSPVTVAENNGVQVNPLVMLREKLGIEELAQSVRELQSLARGQLVQPVVGLNPAPQIRDWKSTLAEIGKSLADAVAKIASSPSDQGTGQVMMQRLLQRDELMNQYLYKLIFGEMPARHVTIEKR